MKKIILQQRKVQNLQQCDKSSYGVTIESQHRFEYISYALRTASLTPNGTGQNTT